MRHGTVYKGADGNDSASGDAAVQQWAADFGWADSDLAALQQAQVHQRAHHDGSDNVCLMLRRVIILRCSHMRWTAHTTQCRRPVWASPRDCRVNCPAQVFLAADTVYDDELTDAFMATAEVLLQLGDGATGVASGAAKSQPAAAVSASPAAPATSGLSPTATAPSRKRMLLALELRYNFTLHDMVCALSDSRSRCCLLPRFHCGGKV